MNLRKLILMALTITTAALAIVACGDSDSNKSTVISGTVSDGPIQNARVYLDLNLNSEYDAGEPSAMTDADGKYSIECSSTLCAKGTKHFIVAEGSQELGTVDPEDNGTTALDFVMFVGASVGTVGEEVTGDINPSSFIGFLKELDGDYASADFSVFSDLMATTSTDDTAIFQNHIMNRKEQFQNGFTNISADVAGDFASAANAAKIEKTIVFESVDAPETDEEKRAISASSKVTIRGKEYDIAYNTILRSGQTPEGDTGVFGRMYDRDGEIILNDDATEFISNSNDFASLIKGTDGNLYMVSHFENSPGAIYITALSQNLKTGQLTATKTQPIDYSSVNGGWVHCAGSVTPWGTHLGSEEYEPNAANVDTTTGKFNDYYRMAIAKYFGLDPEGTAAGYFSDINVYDYGWQIEVSVTDFDNVEVVKHYTMGRVAHELGYVMPNRKTAYISDDGTNVGLFRFEADTAGDLSAGNLYVAKWNQTSAENDGAATLEWIDLGHATNAEIKTYLDNGTTFTDIFNTEDPVDDACPTDGFTIVNTTTGQECLQVKTGMAKAASRLETRRYAAMQGGTTEFRKMEGITLDPDTMTMYLAISEIARGMEDNMKNGSATTRYDGGGYNHITLPMNRCGAVYALNLNDDYVAQDMTAVVSGIPVTADYGAADDSNAYAEGGAFENNKCSLEGLANPDNVTFMPGYKTLIIGEDTGSGHQNDAIWSYNVESKELTRIQTTPYGAETTSPYFYPNINGWAYLMSVVQHPYGESDQDQAEPGSDETKAYTGYIGPFPAMN